MTKDQTIRMKFSGNRNRVSNLGVGAYDLPERAYSHRGQRLQHHDPGSRAARAALLHEHAVLRQLPGKRATRSAFESPTIRVNEAFTSRRSAARGPAPDRASYSLQSDLDYVRGIHSWRAGIAMDGSGTDPTRRTDYLGTYTFESMDDYEAGIPRSFTRRTGNPLISYSNVQAGVLPPGRHPHQEAT